MGNGRRSGNSRGWGRVLGAGLALVGAGCVVLGLSVRHPGQNARLQVPDSLISTAMSAAAGGAANSKPDLHAVLGQLPLIFEPNQGQAASNVRFLARGAGYGLFLDSAGAVLAVSAASPAQSGSSAGQRATSVRMKLIDPNPHATLAGIDPLPGRTNYFVGNDPRKWHSKIPQFAGVRYEKIYPGIDLVFYGNRGRLEYDFHVAPGADPSLAEMEFEGATRLNSATAT